MQIFCRNSTATCRERLCGMPQPVDACVRILFAQYVQCARSRIRICHGSTKIKSRFSIQTNLNRVNADWPVKFNLSFINYSASSRALTNLNVPPYSVAKNRPAKPLDSVNIEVTNSDSNCKQTRRDAKQRIYPDVKKMIINQHIKCVQSHFDLHEVTT